MSYPDLCAGHSHKAIKGIPWTWFTNSIILVSVRMSSV